MPILSRFYGISIKMYFQQSEHNPPHFHAMYGEYVGVIDIEHCCLIEGDLPQRELRLVKKWLKMHKDELLTIWKTQKFSNVLPLE